MRLDYYPPTPRLRPLLTMHAVVHGVDCPRMEVLPAMLPNLHIRLAGDCSYQFGDAPPVPAPPVALIGPTRTAYRMAFGPGLCLLTIGLLPAGWQSLVRVPGDECADRLFAADGLWGAAAVDRLLAQLHGLPLDGRHTGAVEAFVSAALAAPGPQRLQQLQSVDHWLEGSASLSLDELSAHLGVGARQLRRITEESHGMSPKILAMKYRALRLAAALSRQRPATAPEHEAEQALLLYTDQSHAIRDFQRFVGWTPAAFGNEPRGTARATLAGRLRAGAHRPLALLS